MDMNFRLTPAYCLFNGAGIKSQSGSQITFILENIENEILKERLIKAFKNHISYIRQNADCPDAYRRIETIKFEKATRAELRKYVSSLYEDVYTLKDDEQKKSQDEEKEAAAVLLLESLLYEARELGATDIHIEKSQIRFRVQGRLQNGMRLESEKAEELIRRIKLLSGMNVLESRRSQDGQFSFGMENPVFVRVSTMGVFSNEQSIMTESVVLRLLDVSRIPLSLPFLGFNLQQIDELERLVTLNSGLILICGPTGSGKSTTAASMLMELSKNSNGGLKIMSLEEPPEYIIPGVTQIKIDSQNGNSFENVLEHIFRQDPDVIMIGEIRDEQSCETAVRASLTGHLVIATVHTDSLDDTFYRFENFGISNQIFAAVVRGIIIQKMNFFEGKLNLMAELNIPKKNLTQTDLRNEMCFDKYFELYSNAVQVLAKTIGGKKNVKNENKKYVADKSSSTKKVSKKTLITGNKKTGKKVQEA